jgi:hypothetical protein
MAAVTVGRPLGSARSVRLPPHTPHAPVAHANSLIVLTLADDKISAITRFGDNNLFPHFELPRTLPN